MLHDVNAAHRMGEAAFLDARGYSEPAKVFWIDEARALEMLPDADTGPSRPIATLNIGDALDTEVRSAVAAMRGDVDDSFDPSLEDHEGIDTILAFVRDDDAEMGYRPERPVGYVGLALEEMGVRPGAARWDLVVDVSFIFVDADHRGAGVGAALTCAMVSAIGVRLADLAGRAADQKRRGGRAPHLRLCWYADAVSAGGARLTAMVRSELETQVQIAEHGGWGDFNGVSLVNEIEIARDHRLAA